MLDPRDILVLLLCITVHYIYRSHRRILLPYPPGLPRWPLFGNAFSIPLRNSHIFYKELGEKLGSKIMYLEALGRKIVVLNDFAMARRLLEGRSALYSSRPHSTMVVDLAGLDIAFGLMPYGDEWRNHRRLFQQYFSPRTLARDQERELEFIRKVLLPNIHQAPLNFHDHIRSCVGAFSTAITYGLRVRRSHDPLVQLADDAFGSMVVAAAPGKYLVDVMPVLRHIPDWMPGASFKRVARECKALTMRVLEVPYHATLKVMEDGTAQDSFVPNLLERYGNRPDADYQALHIKQTAMQVYGAAHETTVAACLTFVLAMLMHPDVQQKAQCEIDSLVGHDRLPDFSDKLHLPYLSAVLKEVLRWNPIVPLGVPHLTSDEDVYEGYYIPKGCVVISNTYAMLHNEEFFPSPEEFKPERFLKNGEIFSGVPDPEAYATFGFGRRKCPGSHIALSTLYLVAVSILSLFDISPELDAGGNPVEVVPEWVTGTIVSEPKRFPVKITPRKGKDIESLLKEYMDVEVV